MTPTDAFIDQGYGYQPPEHWELWHQSAQDSGSLSEPLDDLSAAYTNEFIEGWNAQ
jgi:NitT/TauT family transport system substrate-binding protein